MPSSMLDAALEYAARGWAVIPLRPRGKEPIIRRGSKEATTDEDQIRKWWGSHPQANIGICTGSISGLVVVDLDGAGALGVAEAAGIASADSLQAITGREEGGRHVYYSTGGRDVRNRAKMLPGVDVRGEGGYVVAPPSIHPSGAVYEWDNDEPLEPMPQALVDLLAAKRPPALGGGGGVSVGTITEGSRNDQLFRWGCAKRAAGADDDEVAMLVAGRNARDCKPPLSDDEVRQIVESVCTYDAGNTAPDLDVAVSQLERMARERGVKFDAEAARDVVREVKASGEDGWEIVDVRRRVVDDEGTSRFRLSIKHAGRSMELRGVTASELTSYAKLRQRALGTPGGFLWPRDKGSAKAFTDALEAVLEAGVQEEQGSSQESAAAVAYQHLCATVAQLETVETKEEFLLLLRKKKWYDPETSLWWVHGPTIRKRISGAERDINSQAIASAFARAKACEIQPRHGENRPRVTTLFLPSVECA